MKKSLLTLTVLLGAVTAMAQKPAGLDVSSELQGSAKKPVLTQTKAPTMASANKVESKPSLLDNSKNAPARSYSSGNYFHHPEGTFYGAWDTDDNGTIATRLLMPLGYTAAFVPRGTRTPTWSWDGTTISMQGRNYNFEMPYAASDWPGPIATAGNDEFSLGTNNLYYYGVSHNISGYSDYSSYTDELKQGVMGMDTVPVYLMPVDDHSVWVSNGAVYNNMLLWGYLNTDYMFGSGKITDMSQYGLSGSATSFAMDQVMGTTAAPMYVENIAVQGFSSSNRPIRGNARLRALVCGVKRMNNGSLMADPTKVYATLYASANNISGFTADENHMITVDDQTKYLGHVIFSNITTDEFGSQTQMPFIIPGNTQFAIYIDGFDNNNIDFGPMGYHQPQEEDAEIGHVYIRMDNNRSETHVLGYDEQANEYNAVAAVKLYGFYDGVTTPEHPQFLKFFDSSLNYNVVRVTSDGTTDLTEGAEVSRLEDEEGTGIPGFIFQTSFEPFDDYGNLRYQVKMEGVNGTTPSWIKGVQLYSFEGIDNAIHSYYVTVTCDENTGSGRWARITFTNPTTGAVSNGAWVLQGDDMTYAQAYQEWQQGYSTGISSVNTEKKAESNNAIYNLAGQRVGKDFKGIVIKNGKKLIQK